MAGCFVKHSDNFTFTFVVKQQEKKVNVSLCITKYHAMKTYWGVEV
jgi:hypothetical protein